MLTLPQLIEEDVAQLQRLLRELRGQSDATAALLIDKGGFLLAQHGETAQFDPTTIAALSSGAYLANQCIANLVQEKNFDSVYQQGEKFSLLITNVDEHCLLVIIFQAHLSVGAVKFFAAQARTQVAAQMQVARARNPDAGLDLSVLNLENPSVVFRKKG
jgi:predicted regulator of Ras-like GTPase activity (Roadblock/LC7/MglB family)